jgi:hypothetical protein
MALFRLAVEWRECVSDLLCRYNLPGQNLYPALAKLRDVLLQDDHVALGEAIDDLRLNLIDSLKQFLPPRSECALDEQIALHPGLSREARLLRLLGFREAVVSEIDQAKYAACVFFALSVGELLGHPPLRPPPRGPGGPGGSGIPRLPISPRRSPGQEKKLDDDL